MRIGVARVLWVVLALVSAPMPAAAAIVTLEFAGTYDLPRGTVFGPYTYSITYDTALDTDTQFYPAGTPIGIETAGHSLYAYSASGILGTSLTFGTNTWTAADLVPELIGLGTSADFWLDSDLSVGPPTRAALSFVNGHGSLGLGGRVAAGQIYLVWGSVIANEIGGRGSSDTFTIKYTAAPDPVPEPPTTILLGIAVACWAGTLLRKGEARVTPR